MARKIKDEFINYLKDSELLKIVRADDTLDMQLRGNKIVIYYRGCAILTMDETCKLEKCDAKYFERTGTTSIIPKLDNFQEYFSRAKEAINKFIFEYKENSETEVQQLIVRENNYSTISNETDYFIIDIEYKNKEGKEFDLITLRWDADKNLRKEPKVEKLAITIFELKYGVKAVGSSSKASKGKNASISKHIADFKNFEKSTDFKKDMIEVFKQKCELGLIRFGEKKKDYIERKIGNNNYSKIDVNQVAEIKMEFGYIFANYNKKSTLLKEELSRFKDDFIYISSSFMGYGLYSSEIRTRAELEKILS